MDDLGKISIHALREEGDCSRRSADPQWHISIHALREEGDKLSSIVKLPPHIISIHALREEGDVLPQSQTHFHLISIHALREEGDHGLEGLPHSHEISIHALREEGDKLHHVTNLVAINFYPRPPRGGRR